MLDILAAEPEKAELLMPYLQAGINSPFPESQSAALLCAAKVVEVRNDLAQDVFPWVQSAVVSPHASVRQTALLAGAEMAISQPALALPFTPMLNSAMQDNDAGVRTYAHLQAGRLVLSSPTSADYLLSRMLKGADDASPKVQIATQVGLAAVIKTRRDLAPSCEAAIEKGLADVVPDLNTAAAANVLLMRDYGLMETYNPRTVFNEMTGSGGGGSGDPKRRTVHAPIHRSGYH